MKKKVKKKVTNRKGVFIGAYVNPVLKRDLQLAATAEYRTLSQDVEHRLTLSLYGKSEVPGGKSKGRLQAALLQSKGRAARGGELRQARLVERLRRLVEGNVELFGYREGEDTLGRVVALVGRLAASPELTEVAALRRRRTVAAPCGGRYQRHRFRRKPGGPLSRKCVRCKAPNKVVTAGGRKQAEMSR